MCIFDNLHARVDLCATIVEKALGISDASWHCETEKRRETTFMFSDFEKKKDRLKFLPFLPIYLPIVLLAIILFILRITVDQRLC